MEEDPNDNSKSKNDITRSNAGTKAFMAPESWEKKEFQAKPLDIWATGVTLYFMIYGFMPFKEKKIMDLKDEICSRPLYYPEEPVLPLECKNFLLKMLEKNPDQRITAKEMLQDPWLTNKGQILLRNEINHSLEVNKQDLEKAIKSSTQLTASFMIALGLKRSLKKARNSILLNESLNASVTSKGSLFQKINMLQQEANNVLDQQILKKNISYQSENYSDYSEETQNN